MTKVAFAVLATILLAGCGAHPDGSASYGVWRLRQTEYGPECYRKITYYGEYMPREPSN